MYKSISHREWITLNAVTLDCPPDSGEVPVISDSFSSICISTPPFSALPTTLPACVIYDIIVRPHEAGLTRFRGLASRYEMQHPASLTSARHTREFWKTDTIPSAVGFVRAFNVALFGETQVFYCINYVLYCTFYYNVISYNNNVQIFMV